MNRILDNQKKTGILFIHGFFGHPLEFESLQKQCHQAGYKTKAISLPGHGEHLGEPIANISIEAVLTHCQNEYDNFAATVDNVIILGHSLGGLCSLLLAADKPAELSCVTSLSSPLKKAHSFNNPLGFLKYKPKEIVKGATYWPEQATGFPRPKLSKRRLISECKTLNQEIHKLFSVIPKPLENIEVPTLLAHSRFDMMVPFSEMTRIKQALNQHIIVETLELKQCGHQIFPSTGEAQRVSETFLSFISKHR